MVLVLGLICNFVLIIILMKKQCKVFAAIFIHITLGLQRRKEHTETESFNRNQCTYHPDQIGHFI